MQQAQKGKWKGKSQGVEESKVAGEIVVQRMRTTHWSSGVLLSRRSFLIHNIKDPCQKHFEPQIEKGLVCDVLSVERGPSCNKVAQIPNKKVFYFRFVKSEGDLEEEKNRSREVSVDNN